MSKHEHEDGKEVNPEPPKKAHRWVDDGTFSDDELDEFQHLRRTAGLKPV